MKAAALSLGLVLALTVAAPGQEKPVPNLESKEGTSAFVADKMAEITIEFQTDWQKAGITDEMTRRLIASTTTRVLALRDALAGNRYVRVAGFSVGFPGGVSVEFTLPEPEHPR